MLPPTSPASLPPKASDIMAMLPMAPLQQDLGVDVIGLATPPATGEEIGLRDGCNYGAAAGDEDSFTTLTKADGA